VSRQDQRAALFLRPTVLGSLLVLVINDQWAKVQYKSWVTGKLSDVAGVYALPVVIAAILASRRPSATIRLLFASAVLTALGFAMVKLTREGNAAWGWSLGGLRWAVRAPLVPFGRHLGSVRRVEALRDPTDLLAVLVTPLAVFLGSRAIRRGSSLDLEVNADRGGRIVFAADAAGPEADDTRPVGGTRRHTH